METVIKKLSEIEVAAKKIMDNANAELKVLDARMQENSDAFDAQVEADTRRRLGELRENLEKENNAALKKLKDDTEKGLTHLNQYYEEHHEALADEIVKRIIGV
ncbi:hypothetical protein [Ruminococcus gauvreauii]|uniref:ATPase n=1 Tax=Ruminococcus gauvreauii TaxID=438033 RepID=A0ABY5VDF3_9FIRM|nr:hypothetical protein [Ruminococcus gauvreauii]UWP57983.1 hypothetical protein NQ502_11305 [Ruminococcus gauvreauii]